MKNAKIMTPEDLNNFMTKNFTFQLGSHKRKEVIWIIFPYNADLIKFLKSNFKPFWSNSLKMWYVYDTVFNRKLIGLEQKLFSNTLFFEIAPENQQALQKYIEQLQLKGYSANTIRTYTNEFIQLLKTLKKYPINQLTSQKLRSYFLYCINTLKLSENLIHSRMNAIKFYFEQVLFREKLFLEIPRPRKHSTLPKAISVRDIRKMLAVVKNIKHELLLKMCYGMGLRVSELVNLKISDIDSGSMQVFISRSKGKKDRIVALPQSVLELLRTYYKEYKPQKYLFEGQRGGQYAVRSAQLVFKSALEKAKINKKVGIHGLRHSYATHLIEQGTDILFVKDLLGHNNIKTTMIYTHITDISKRKIKSPLDNI